MLTISEELLKKISLKTTKHSTSGRSSSNSLGSQKLLQNKPKRVLQAPTKKRRQVKKNDIMEMIYPSYRDSFKQAVSSMQQTLRGTQKPVVRKMKQAQQDMTAQILAVSQARIQDKKNLTVVRENQEEDEEDSQHFISRRPTQGVPSAIPELEVRDSTIEYIENIEEESIMDFTKLEKWVEKSGEKTAAETPEKGEEIKIEDDEEEEEETEEMKHQRIIKDRIVANKFGASFGHEKAKIEDLVKGDQMCRSFALSLLKHIEFSQGAFHIDDLNMEVDEPDALQFSYNLGNSLLKFKKKPIKEEEAKRANSRNFQELERRLASSDESKKEETQKVETSVQSSTSPFDSPPGKQEDEVSEEEILEYLSDKEESAPRKTQTAKTIAEEIVVKEEEQVVQDEATEDLDFDYTETQLQDFLQSYKQTGGFENLRDSKVKTSSLISSFLRSLNRFNSNSQKNISISRKITVLEPIDSHSEESPDGKSPSPIKKKQSRQKAVLDSDEDDDLERDPVSPSIDIKKDMDTIAREVPAFHIKPMEAVEGMSAEQFELAEGNDKKDATNLVLQGDNQHYLNVKHGRPLRPDQTLLESQYEVPKDSKANVREYLLETMKIFDQNYNYEEQRVMGEYPPHFWGNPVQDELFEFCHYILVVSKMETEIPILALAYIERLLLKTGLLLNFSNWRKLVLITMILASKVRRLQNLQIWDDDSFQNQHFAQVFPQFTLKEINALERTLLELLEYNLMIKGSEYAKFFFLLRTLYDTKYKKGKVDLPMVPMVDGLQKKTLKAADILKGRHQLDRTL